MNWKLIQLFNKAPAYPCDLKTFKELNEKAMKAGYLIHPDCCGPEVEKFLENETYNPNSTFYKTFEDVVSKDRLELAFDQWMHYTSTYGTGHTQEGNGFTQNDEPAVLEYNKYKVIMPATNEEIFEECYGMLKSGIALDKNTLNLLMEFIIEYDFNDKVDADEILNKEAQAIFSVEMGIYPKQPISVLRVLMYLLTENTAMLVKSKESIRKIKLIVGDLIPSKKANLARILKERDVALSTIFYRYKPIILAMKCKETAPVINHIRKLAVKNHKPMKVGFWERCLDPKDQQDAYIKEAKSKVESLTAFKKAQLMQGIVERINGQDIKGRMFIIRNGKTFVREDYKTPCDEKYLAELYDVLKTSYIDNLKKKAVTKVVTQDAEGNEVVLERPTRIKLPAGLELTLPTSEKNFVGNYPMGTSIPLADGHNVIGVYWREDWGVRDYDLHFVDKQGHHYGWNGGYHDGKTGKVVYSGDMTSANPEAAECIYIQKAVPDGVFSLNKFSGQQKSKFKLFVAVDPSKEGMDRRNCHTIKDAFDRAMVDPNKIVFEAELTHEDYGQKVIAKVENGKLVMSNLTSAGGRVPSVAMMKVMEAQSRVKAESFIKLNDILDEAGFELVEDEPDLDFSQMSKNDIIKLVQ